jgi:hypothetical protein
VHDAANGAAAADMLKAGVCVDGCGRRDTAAVLARAAGAFGWACRSCSQSGYPDRAAFDAVTDAIVLRQPVRISDWPT